MQRRYHSEDSMERRKDYILTYINYGHLKLLSLSFLRLVKFRKLQLLTGRSHPPYSLTAYFHHILKEFCDSITSSCFHLCFWEKRPLFAWPLEVTSRWMLISCGSNNLSNCGSKLNWVLVKVLEKIESTQSNVYYFRGEESCHQIPLREGVLRLVTQMKGNDEGMQWLQDVSLLFRLSSSL